jgi:adenosylmethionine-8-amino-7-oxononanoate aminotransferase
MPTPLPPDWIGRLALDHGLLARPIGDCLYLMPPLCTPPARLREAGETLRELLG